MVSGVIYFLREIIFSQFFWPKFVHFTVTRGPWLYGWSLGNVGYYQAGDINRNGIIWRLYWFLSLEYERTGARTGIFPKKIFSLANFSNLRGKWSHLATLRYWDHFDCMDDFCGLCWNGGSITLSMINANIGIKILGLVSKYSGSFWNLDQHCYITETMIIKKAVLHCFWDQRDPNEGFVTLSFLRLHLLFASRA